MIDPERYLMTLKAKQHSRKQYHCRRRIGSGELVLLVSDGRIRKEWLCTLLRTYVQQTGRATDDPPGVCGQAAKELHLGQTSPPASPLWAGISSTRPIGFVRLHNLHKRRLPQYTCVCVCVCVWKVRAADCLKRVEKIIKGLY